MIAATGQRCESCGTSLKEVNKIGGAWLCMSCAWSSLPTDAPAPSFELGTRNGNKELGTRSTSTPLKEHLVPSSQRELGSGSTPSSHVDALTVEIVEDVRQLRAERVAKPPKAGDPNVVPYSLGFAVKRGKARDKNEAKRAIDAAVKSGALVLEYELAPRGKAFGTRCYSVPDGSGA